MKHIKLFETYDYGSVGSKVLNLGTMKNLGITHDDYLECERIVNDIAKRVGDSGSCVLGAGLMANGKKILSAYAQGSLGCEEAYEAVKKFLEPKYKDIKFSIEWGNMD